MPFKTTNDKFKIMELIILRCSNKYYMPDADQLFKFCRSNYYGTEFDHLFQTIDDIQTPKYILSQLNLLFYFNFPINVEINPNDFDNYMEKIKENYLMPLFIDNSFFNSQYKLLILFQVNEMINFRKEIGDPIQNLIKFKFSNNFDHELRNIQYDKHFHEFIDDYFDKNKTIKYINNDDEYSSLRNNMIAVQFLSKKTNGIINLYQPIDTFQDKVKILELIFTKQIYCINPDYIFAKCKKEFESKKIDINIKNIDDILQSPKNTLTLIKCLFNLNIHIKDDLKPFDFDESLKNLFNHYSPVKIFINRFSFNELTKFLVLIQISCILDYISSNPNVSSVINYQYSFANNQYSEGQFIYQSDNYNQSQNQMQFGNPYQNQFKIGNSFLNRLQPDSHQKQFQPGNESQKQFQPGNESQKQFQPGNKFQNKLQSKNAFQNQWQPNSPQKQFQLENKFQNKLQSKNAFQNQWQPNSPQKQFQLENKFQNKLQSKNAFQNRSQPNSPQKQFQPGNESQNQFQLENESQNQFQSKNAFKNRSQPDSFQNQFQLGNKFQNELQSKNSLQNRSQPDSPQKQFQPGNESQKQFQPGNKFQNKLQSKNAFQNQWQPNSPQKQFQPGNESQKQFQPGNESQKQFQPGNESQNQFQPGNKFQNKLQSKNAFQNQSQPNSPQKQFQLGNESQNQFQLEDESQNQFQSKNAFQNRSQPDSFQNQFQLGNTYQNILQSKNRFQNQDDLSNMQQNENNTPDNLHIITNIKENHISDESEYSDDLNISDNYDDDENSENKNEETQIYKSRCILDDVLLKTINSIFANIGLKLNNFHQAVKNDAIPKFVMLVLKLERIANVKIEKTSIEGKLTPIELKNIKAVINFLKIKDSRFKVLIFDFQNPKFVETSAILFYTNFLNFFFLKEKKEDLLNKCAAILNCENNIQLLMKWKTYSTLVFYLKNEKLNEKEINQDEEDELFRSTQIPKLFDQQFLDNFQSQDKPPDALYYQLQFIFNIFNFTLPDKIKQIRDPHLDKAFSQRDFNRIGKTFTERLQLYSLQIEKSTSESKLVLTNIEAPEKYWNLPDINYSFDNGVLYNKTAFIKQNRQLKIDWKNEMKKILDNIEPTKTKNKKEEVKQIKISYEPILIKDSNSKPYKFFIYDDNEAKWKFNEEMFIKFGKDSSINNNKIATPLVLFLDSFTEDLITINSSFINGSYPELNENKHQIYVYGFCYKQNGDNSNEKQGIEIKPIFLFLHVPKKRVKNQDIRSIVVQIYAFLSFICDVKVMILNDTYYKDQIELIECLNNMFSKENIKKITKRKSKIFIEQTENENESLNNDDSNESKVKDNENTNCDNNNDEGNCVLVKLKSNSIAFERKSKFILLANDSIINSNEKINKYLHQSLFFNMLFSSIGKENYKFHVIDSNNANTYQPFLSSLQNYIINCKTFFNDIMKAFNFVQMSEISNAYIQLKNQKNWKKGLKKLIFDRFSNYKSNPDNKSSSIASKISEELLLISSPFDSEFNHECNSILNKMEKKNDKNRIRIFEELNISHEIILSEFERQLHDKSTLFYSQSQKTNMLQENYVHFMKKEYFDIIKYFSQSKNINIIYGNNIDLLNRVIKKGLTDITEKVNTKNINNF